MSDIFDTVKKGLEAIEAKFDSKYRELQAQVIDTAQRQTGHPGVSTKTGPAASGSIARLLEGSESLQALRERKSKSAIVTADFGLDVLVKTALTGDIQSDTDQYPGQAFRDQRIANDRRAPLSLIERMPRIPVNSGSFEFVQISSSYADDAAYQLVEGAAKHETAMPVELQTATVATIATVLPVSEQALSDNGNLAQFISSKLSYQALVKLQHEVINGAGGAGEISGLLTEGTPYVPTSGNEASDSVGELAAYMMSLGWTPNVVLLHPSTWHAIRSVRVDAGTGLYLAGGWDMPPQPSIWGVPVIATPAMPTTKCIVADTTQLALLDRQGVSFDFGYVNDQFARNMRTARAELRAGLAVFSPTAVQVFDI